MFYVYVLQNEDGEFYLGSTPDLKRRLAEHNKSEGFYTSKHKWNIVYYEAYMSLKTVRKREHSLKKGKGRSLLMKRIKESLSEVSK